MVAQTERIVDILNHQQELAGKAVKMKALNAEKTTKATTGNMAGLIWGKILFTLKLI